VRKRQDIFGRTVWRKRMAYFLSLALLLLVPATLPAVCRPVAVTCTNGCCMPDMVPSAGSAVAMPCCQAVNSQGQLGFVSPDLGQLAAASLIQLAPPQIVHSFYEGQKTLRELSAFEHPTTPQIDPLLKTTQLLI